MMTRDTCWTSMPRARRSVVMRTREEPERNSRMMMSRVVLVHVAVRGGDGEVARAHLLREPVDLAAGVAKMIAWVMASVSYRSHRVSSFHSSLLHVDVELLDTLERQLVALHEDAHRLSS